MTDLEKRLATLNARHERLIDGNTRNGWVRTKSDKYFDVIGRLNKERILIMREISSTLDKSKYKTDFRNVMYYLNNPL